MEAARQQAEPQRLLFVFLKASLPENRKAEELSSFYAGQGGELEPVMCVDKALEELADFAGLVKESEGMKQDWHIVLVAGLSGRNGVDPGSAEVEGALKIMVDTVQAGGDLSKFMAFDRNGGPVQFN